jgi:hypothetical protein
MVGYATSHLFPFHPPSSSSPLSHSCVCRCIAAASNSAHRHHRDWHGLCTTCTIGLSRPSQSPMHRCLRIQELLALIFSHLDLTEHSGRQSYNSRQPTLQDLAVLARTCCTFHGPALDHLWRSSALVNLLRCMPADLWMVDEVGEPPWKCNMVSGLAR